METINTENYTNVSSTDYEFCVQYLRNDKLNESCNLINNLIYTLNFKL